MSWAREQSNVLRFLVKDENAGATAELVWFCRFFPSLTPAHSDVYGIVIGQNLKTILSERRSKENDVENAILQSFLPSTASGRSWL
jgi:hypothetical protein